ncbi:hypothetical protein [Flavihumibacter sp. CACIAM 22H1]|uniref:hypothetical protein n=1 Tax=Flavihumibacter sp. CACIAM 22H1 TaxID=1812911 RepID=UPI0007A90E8F|nr:hypothetical protein [Flavihumibacter sp. CACIAM 22H1]KYP16117.1 MAG: hypothetical protein A1D16_18830 [Flavihumibacter sp. CACIAM 22H1]
MLHFYPKPLGILLCISLIACSKSKKPDEAPPAIFGAATGVALHRDFPGEVSGLADSYSYPGSLWMIEDGGNAALLQRVSQDGVLQPSLTINGVTNRDWEDLAMGPGPDPSKNYLYIAETGDNDRKYAEYAFYRLEEPPPGTSAVNQVEAIRFRYSDGASHDAGAILVDPSTKDLLVVTKEKPAAIYRIQYPYQTTALNTAEAMGVTNLETVTGAAMGKDGQEILLRTYTGIYYWKKKSGETVSDALKRAPAALTVMLEPQGESIAFKNDLTGFYSLSENAGLPVQLRLFFYPRKN